MVMSSYDFIFSGNDSVMTSGTTATVCLLRNGIELVVGHVGDSRATLCRSGQSLRLTNDHEPDNLVEKARIERSGGHVTWSSLGKPRVNGRLQMTRSIGDVDLKPYGVTAEPEVQSIEVMKFHLLELFISVVVYIKNLVCVAMLTPDLFSGSTR